MPGSAFLVRTFTWIFTLTFVLTACSGGGSSSPTPTTSASPTSTTSPVGVLPTSQPTVAPTAEPTGSVNAAAFTCPTSDTAASVASGRRTVGDAARRRPAHHTRSTVTGATQLVAVTYDANSTALASQRAALSARESALGATVARSYTFAHTGRVTHVLRVPAARAATVVAALRMQAGVRSVGLTGARRYASSVNGPLFPNDPYFTGFSSPVAVNGVTPASTYKVGPLEENADVPGQWDMHAIRLEYAFAYGQAGNGSGITNIGALGSSSVKLALIDTGQDSTHPELQSKIAYQRCFVTNPDTGTQSTSTYSTDPAGHGTDVAGIAGAAINNSLGFTGASGKVSLYAYRVFPTPDDNCTSDDTTDSQCSTNTTDVASAIEDAVTARVNVINLSLGGGSCTNGADPDTVEGQAIEDALAANIVVVAAAGNGSGPPIEAPACDTGVIAVGATAIADGTTNGSSKSGGSSASPFEYVASYTDYGSTGAAVNSSTAWGIVAPGGDPASDSDSDDLHWIENLWTSTPADSNFAGSCTGDYPGDSGTTDCRELIAGTSMATPHVAGAAALIISANASYQSPTLMKQLLCATADDISDADEGCGRLNVYRAMAVAVGDTNAPPTSPTP